MIDAIAYFISLLFLLIQSFITKYNVKRYILNKAIKNGFNNFISHEIIVCDDKHTPWINTEIKGVSQKKSNVYRYYQVTEVFK